jgi:predicted ester cyclase
MADLERNKATTRAMFEDIWRDHRLERPEGDLVAEHVTFSGTHTGAPFHGIEPSGAAFSFTQTTISRVEDGLITDVWEDFDWHGLLRQLGA